MRTKVQLVNRVICSFLACSYILGIFQNQVFILKKVVIEKGVLCKILVFFLT